MKNEKQFDHWLKEAKKEGSSLEPSYSVWHKIQNEIKTEQIKKPWWDRALDMVAPKPKYQVAFAAFTMIIVTVIMVMNREPELRLISDNEAAMLATEIDRKVFESQRLYEEVLAALEKQVEMEIPEEAHEVFELYKEKVKMLDTLIAECKLNLQENPYNPNIHKSLFYAYSEKLTNLKTMLALNKEIIS
ncbi:MAG: hypothetical protein ISR82_07155 [Candidatus Marinimicrobia bacterium]|nr:hypothetical protein [Candidatus Neomarinimicrobiota bacterium]MBL7010982.1 hypothetical protein [Candidatus Neomarinimicrobiota bacterium]MBL7031118.1 hypothetical protein [Candidatus Neomarinimicrobiota bacterium]